MMFSRRGNSFVRRRKRTRLSHSLCNAIKTRVLAECSIQLMDSNSEPVAVLGRVAAEDLGINRFDQRPVIFIGDQPFEVIRHHRRRRPRIRLLAAIILPNHTAQTSYNLAAPGSVRIDVGGQGCDASLSQAPISVTAHPAGHRHDKPLPLNGEMPTSNLNRSTSDQLCFVCQVCPIQTNVEIRQTRNNPTEGRESGRQIVWSKLERRKQWKI
jgi:hypothetical protein